MKKSIKVIFALIIAVIAVFSATACEKEVFYSNNGLTIFIDESFKAYSDPYLTVAMENDDGCYFQAIKERIVDLEASGYENMVDTAGDYADILIKKNGFNTISSVVDKKAFFECETIENGVTYYNSFMVLNGADRTYWTCRFMCEVSKKDKYSQKFKEWFNTILV